MELWKAWAIPETPRKTGKTKYGVVTWGPSGAGIWSAPTLDLKRRVFYVGTGNNYSDANPPATDHSDAVLAFDLESGKLLWTSQVTPGDIFNGGCSNAKNCPGPDFDFGASVLIEKLPNGKDILLAGQKSGMVYGLDPDAQGKVLWKTRVGKGGTNGGVQWGMASDGQRVYASVSDLARLRKADADPLDPRPNAADPKQGGGLTALRIADGEKAWFAAPSPCGSEQPQCSPAQPAAVTAISGAVFQAQWTAIYAHSPPRMEESCGTSTQLKPGRPSTASLLARRIYGWAWSRCRGRNGLRQFRLRAQWCRMPGNVLSWRLRLNKNASL